VITINIVGDFFFSSTAIEYAEKNGYHVVYNDLLPLLIQKDVSLVNVESPITNVLDPIRKTGPNLLSSPLAIEILKYGGFDIACLANNHILDQGAKGLINTIELCKHHNIQPIGAGSDLDEANKIFYKDMKGIRIAIINITENEFSIADKSSAGAAPYDLINNFKTIRKAKENSDYVLMIFHGGMEHYHLPTPNMVKTLRFFVDCGVDAIVCHHSHYPTGYEFYDEKPIVYGTGNFFFDLPAPTKQWNLGYLVTLKIDFTNKRTGLEIVPFSQNRETFGISVLNKVEKDSFMEELNRLSKIIQNEEELLQNWKDFNKEQSLAMVSSLFPFIPFKRKVLTKNKLPKLVEAKIRGMMNSCRCESMREFYIGSLDEYLKMKS
jgi:poly-gamma-glutamate synthesis protein (capsule biosynthesis protein)